jgi:hypothetical protein
MAEGLTQVPGEGGQGSVLSVSSQVAQSGWLLHVGAPACPGALRLPCRPPGCVCRCCIWFHTFGTPITSFCNTGLP